MNDKIKDILNFPLDGVGETGRPLGKRKSSKKTKVDTPKNKEFVFFFDEDGNSVEPGTGDVYRGEIWTYDNEGRLTKTYVGDFWNSANSVEEEVNGQQEDTF